MAAVSPLPSPDDSVSPSDSVGPDASDSFKLLPKREDAEVDSTSVAEPGRLAKIKTHFKAWCLSTRGLIVLLATVFVLGLVKWTSVTFNDFRGGAILSRETTTTIPTTGFPLNEVSAVKWICDCAPGQKEGRLVPVTSNKNNPRFPPRQLLERLTLCTCADSPAAVEAEPKSFSNCFQKFLAKYDQIDKQSPSEIDTSELKSIFKEFLDLLGVNLPSPFDPAAPNVPRDNPLVELFKYRVANTPNLKEDVLSKRIETVWKDKAKAMLENNKGLAIDDSYINGLQALLEKATERLENGRTDGNLYYDSEKPGGIRYVDYQGLNGGEVEDPRILIVGDLHGSVLDLHQLLLHERLDGLGTSYRIVFLGDYVDRGGYSLDTLATVVMLYLVAPNDVILLRGNHETEEQALSKTALCKGHLCLLEEISYRMPLLTNGKVFSNRNQGQDAQEFRDRVVNFFKQLEYAAVLSNVNEAETSTKSLLLAFHAGAPFSTTSIVTDDDDDDDDSDLEILSSAWQGHLKTAKTKDSFPGVKDLDKVIREQRNEANPGKPSVKALDSPLSNMLWVDYYDTYNSQKKPEWGGRPPIAANWVDLFLKRNENVNLKGLFRGHQPMEEYGGIPVGFREEPPKEAHAWPVKGNWNGYYSTSHENRVITMFTASKYGRNTNSRVPSALGAYGVLKRFIMSPKKTVTTENLETCKPDGNFEIQVRTDTHTVVTRCCDPRVANSWLNAEGFQLIVKYVTANEIGPPSAFQGVREEKDVILKPAFEKKSLEVVETKRND